MQETRLLDVLLSVKTLIVQIPLHESANSIFLTIGSALVSKEAKSREVDVDKAEIFVARSID